MRELTLEVPTGPDPAALKPLGLMIRRLVAEAYPGEPLTKANFEERLALVARQLPEEVRVKDWKAWVPPGRIKRYIAEADVLLGWIDKVTYAEPKT